MRAILPASAVAELEAQSSPAEALRRLVAEARALALPPISDYHVGAALRGVSGAVYLGFNLEFQGLGLQHTVHAEQACVALAHWSGERGLSEMAVSAPPCGHCRQFLRESQRNLRILLPEGEGLNLADLLPYSFGPEDLGHSMGMMSRSGLPRTGEGLELARAAAEHSWAPYSRTRAGVAVRSGEKWFAGCYLENAAFNPALNPMQYALVVAHHHGCAPDSVEEVCCWESGEKVSLVAATMAVAEKLPGRPRFSFGSE